MALVTSEEQHSDEKHILELKRHRLEVIKFWVTIALALVAIFSLKVTRDALILNERAMKIREGANVFLGQPILDYGSGEIRMSINNSGHIAARDFKGFARQVWGQIVDNKTTSLSDDTYNFALGEYRLQPGQTEYSVNIPLSKFTKENIANPGERTFILFVRFTYDDGFGTTNTVITPLQFYATPIRRFQLMFIDTAPEIRKLLGESK